MSDLTTTSGEVISTYTVEQAVEDGSLVRVPQPELHGFTEPVLLTGALWATLATPNEGEAEADTTLRVVSLLRAAKDALAHDALVNNGLFAKFSHRIGGEDHDLFAAVDGAGVTVMFPSDY